MKKVLFGSTALVAAAFTSAAVAGDVKLSVSGDIIAGVGVGQFVDGSTDEVEKDFHIIREGEIQFKAKGTLDNGITIEARMELEGYNTETTQDGAQGTSVLDESWVAVSGSFGKILIGNNDTALEAVAGGTGRLGSAVAMGSWDGSYEFVPREIGSVGDPGDFIGIHYYTPNIAGFEAGISWSPTDDEDAEVDTSDDPDNTTDAIAVGVSYSTTFGEADFVIGGGYFTQDEGDDEVNEWGVGAEVGFGAITIGGRYEYSEQEGGDVEVTRFGGGVIYATGPWEFGLNAAFEETDDIAPDADEEVLRVNAGVMYTLGDGVDLGLGVDYGEVDFEDPTEDDVDGFGGALLLGVAF